MKSKLVMKGGHHLASDDESSTVWTNDGTELYIQL